MFTRLKGFVLLLSGFIFIAVLASEADGCICGGTMEGTHPCLLYRSADVVFAGLVVNIGEMIPLNPNQGGQTLYTMKDVVVQFSVEEGFRGVDGPTVDLYLMGTSCDAHFEKGERYIVYARRDQTTKKLHADACGGSRALSYAAQDVAYARRAVRGERDPDIFGSVVRQVRKDVADYARTLGIPGIKVILESRDHTAAVFTDSEGRFEISGLPGGRYKARAELPDTLRVTYRTEREIEVGNGQCTGVAFVATLLSRITGKLVDSDGKPVAETPLNLIPIDANNKAIVSEIEYQAFTTIGGLYVFDSLSPGRYVLVINPKKQPKSDEAPYRRTYYPDATDLTKATVMTLIEGQELTLDDFHLPARLVERTIEGVVLWPDGRPVREADVHLDFTDQRWSEELNRVDELGRFRMKCHEGFRYVLHAEVRTDRPMHATPVEIGVGKENKPITLVIDQQGFDRSYAPKPSESPSTPVKQVPKP